MKDHYLVKFRLYGDWIYGIANPYCDESKQAAGQGKIVVEHATLPKSYLVEENQLTDIKMEIGRFDTASHKFVDQDEFHEFVQAEFEKAQQISDALPDGLHVGKLFGIGVGDGTAWYVITKINKKTVKVEWRGFCLDRWTDRYLGWGRTCPIDYVEPLVRQNDAANKLFG